MTQNLFAVLREHVVDALQALVPELTPEHVARVEVTPTRDAAHGDMATNAAWSRQSQLGKIRARWRSCWPSAWPPILCSTAQSPPVRASLIFG